MLQMNALLSSLSLAERFEMNFLKSNRWMQLLNGLEVTLLVSVIAVMIGIVLGVLFALLRLSKCKPLSALAGLYIDVIRGTPMVVQLMIFYFVLLGPTTSLNKTTIGALAFGCNSGAYVAEIVRAGIQSIDGGQREAGRSLGLTEWMTMKKIILPQAFKNVLPALANEFITLLKETSVSGYIGLMDLTKAGDIIRSRTFAAFFPLIAVALIYLVIVVALSAGVTKLERRLRNGAR